MDELDEFRKTWRQELTNRKPENDSQLDADVKPSPSLFDFSNDLAAESDKQDEKLPRPFVIAESLLLGETLPSPTASPGASVLNQRNKNVKRKPDDSLEGTEKKPRFLDIFISDLDEINEIPFFDIQIPREVATNIFSHLDLVDLCRCAQVSSSWRSLAEDEVLWCQICHELGFESKVAVNQRDNWKEFVREQMKIGKRIRENWKTRTGALYSLDYVQGGILCAAHSSNTHVAAGYTNGSVKIWHLDGGGDCVLNPSHTALVLDEAADSGTISNYVTHVAVSDEITAAAYNQGFVDIWKNDSGTEPMHTAATQYISGLYVNNDVVAVTTGQTVQVTRYSGGDEPYASCTLNAGSKINHAKLLFADDVYQSSWRSHHTSDPLVAIATDDDVQLYKITDQLNERFQPVPCGAFSTYAVPVCGPIDIHEGVLACPLGMDPVFTTYSSRVKLYDVNTQKEMITLLGNAAYIYALHMTAPNLLVLGCADRMVRLYDTRIQSPIAVFAGHAAHVTTVQTDSWKIVSGSYDGMVSVWDHRAPNIKLWELHNRHPVRYCSFNKQLLVAANIPVNRNPDPDEVDSMLRKRFRGSLHAYDFSVDQTSVAGLPSVCLSSYDEPEGYNYNIRLSMPYDRL